MTAAEKTATPGTVHQLCPEPMPRAPRYTGAARVVAWMHDHPGVEWHYLHVAEECGVSPSSTNAALSKAVRANPARMLHPRAGKYIYLKESLEAPHPDASRDDADGDLPVQGVPLGGLLLVEVIARQTSPHGEPVVLVRDTAPGESALWVMRPHIL